MTFALYSLHSQRPAPAVPTSAGSTEGREEMRGRTRGSQSCLLLCKPLESLAGFCLFYFLAKFGKRSRVRLFKYEASSPAGGRRWLSLSPRSLSRKTSHLVGEHGRSVQFKGRGGVVIVLVVVKRASYRICHLTPSRARFRTGIHRAVQPPPGLFPLPEQKLRP